MVKIQNGINYIEPGETLTTLLSNETPYILYFTASWCGPCRMISPEYERLKQNYPDLGFYKIDIDECEEITSLFNIRSVPTFYLFKKNREYYNKCEGADTQRLSELIRSLNSLYSNTLDEKIEPIVEEKIEPVKEEEIETMFNDIIYYNNMNSMSNYETIEPIEPIEIQNNSDLDRFFDTLNIDTDTEIHEVRPSDLSDISELNL